ncbi:PREDICTED: uncharacterized protein LOC105453082 [Wasmannia auropunctata]|uniref:uncharacterized protein LOC105453082 n=1 Tax=Wasmannia auropunctata TaxID=64793 RepID=UPI0005EFF2CD|nr:PREDICTED: uncharacterized protein LOC105453082 [Wasmannia auropunctata]
MMLATAILSTLVVSLMLGSTKHAQRTYPVSEVRETLRYWRSMYKAYAEDVNFGICLAEYLMKMYNETLMNELERLSKDPNERSTKELQMLPQYPHPPSVPMAPMAPMLEDEGEGKYPQEERPRIDERWPPVQQDNRIHKIERIIDSYVQRRRRAISSAPELLHETPRVGHEFPSRGTGSHAVNPTSNPGDDDKVDSGSTDLGEEEEDSPTNLRRRSSLGDILVKYAYSLLRELLDSLFELWLEREDHGVEGDPAERQAPLNDESPSAPPSRPQDQRANAGHPYRVSVVKLGSEENSSYDPTINSKTQRRKSEKLSRDQLISPRIVDATVELLGNAIRRLFEFRSEAETRAKRDAHLQFERGNDTMGQRHRQPREESSRDRRDVSAAMLHPLKPERSHEKIYYKNRKHIPAMIQRLYHMFHKNREHFRRQKRSVRAARSALVRTGRSGRSWFRTQVVTTFFSIIKTFFQLGRQSVDEIRETGYLTCTKEYFWAKFIKWIDY